MQVQSSMLFSTLRGDNADLLFFCPHSFFPLSTSIYFSCRNLFYNAFSDTCEISCNIERFHFFAFFYGCESVAKSLSWNLKPFHIPELLFSGFHLISTSKWLKQTALADVRLCLVTYMTSIFRENLKSERNIFENTSVAPHTFVSLSLCVSFGQENENEQQQKRTF